MFKYEKQIIDSDQYILFNENAQIIKSMKMGSESSF